MIMPDVLPSNYSRTILSTTKDSVRSVDLSARSNGSEALASFENGMACAFCIVVISLMAN